MDDKVSARIMDLFYNRFLDNDFENIKIKYDVKKLLYNYQYLHVFNIVTSLKNNNIAIEKEITIDELLELILISIYYNNIDKIKLYFYYLFF